MNFKMPQMRDDQDRIRNDVAHDVRVGKNAKVSIGGMRQATIKVTAIGKDGISGTDAKGRVYHFLWEHVIAPTGDQATDVHEAAGADHEAPMQKADDARIGLLKAHINAYRRTSA